MAGSKELLEKINSTDAGDSNGKATALGNGNTSTTKSDDQTQTQAQAQESLMGDGANENVQTSITIGSDKLAKYVPKPELDKKDQSFKNLIQNSENKAQDQNAVAEEQSTTEEKPKEKKEETSNATEESTDEETSNVDENEQPEEQTEVNEEPNSEIEQKIEEKIESIEESAGEEDSTTEEETAAQTVATTITVPPVVATPKPEVPLTSKQKAWNNLVGNVKDSDGKTLNVPDYYRYEITKQRKCAEQVKNLMDAINGMPSYNTIVESINESIAKPSASEKEQKNALSQKTKTIENCNKIQKKFDKYCDTEEYSDVSEWYETVAKSGFSRGISSKVDTYTPKEIKDQIYKSAGIVCPSSQNKLNPKWTEYYAKSELYQKDRDKACLFEQSGDEIKKSGIDLQNEKVMAMLVKGTVVYGIFDKDNKFNILTDKKSIMDKAYDSQKKGFKGFWNGVKSVFSSKSEVRADFEEDYDDQLKIAGEQAVEMKEFGELLDTKGIAKQVNAARINDYKKFDESAFDQKAADYRAQVNAAKDMEGQDNSASIVAPTAESAFIGNNSEGEATDIIDTLEEIVVDNLTTGASKVVDAGSTYLNGTTVLGKEIGGDLKPSATFLENINDNGKTWTFNDGDKDIIFYNNGEDGEPLRDKKGNKIVDLKLNAKEVQKGLCVNGGLGLLKCPLAILDILKGIMDFKDMIKDIKHAKKLDDGGLLSNSAALQIDATELFLKDILGKGAEAGLETAQNIIQILAGTNKRTFDFLKSSITKIGKGASILSIITGAISMAKGGYDIAKGVHDTKQSKNASKKLQSLKDKADGQYDNGILDTANRFTHQYALNSQESTAKGVVKMITGGLDVAAGVLALIPGAGTVAGTVLGAISTLGGILANSLISKYFKNKKVDKAWADMLGYKNVDAFKKFKNKMGGEANMNRVIREKTSVPTGESFAQAGSILDGIDIYTMAKLHSGDPNSKDPTEGIIKETLGGMGYTQPDKYQNLELKDILSKIGVKDDWKSALQNCTIDQKGLFSRKTAQEKEDVA